MKFYKRKKKVRAQKNMYRLFSVLLFALAAVCLFVLFSSYTRTSKPDLSLTPVFSDNMGWELYTYLDDGTVRPLTLEECNADRENTLYLTRTLPVSYETEGYTTLKLTQTNSYAVFLDNALIYSNVPGFTGEPGAIRFPDLDITPIQGESLMVSLPAGYGGKQITIAVKHQSPYSSFSIFLTSQNIEQEIVASLISSRLIPAIFFGVLTLILFTLFLLELNRKDFRLPLFLLFLSALFETLGLLNDLNMYFPAKTVFDTPLTGFIQPFFVHFPLLFFLVQMKKYRRFYAPFVILSFASALIPPSLNLFGITTPFAWFWYPLYLVLPLFFVFAVLEMRAGNGNFRFILKYMLLFFALLAVALAFSEGGQNSIRDYVRIALLPSWPASTPHLLIFWSGTLLLIFGLASSAHNLFLYYTDLQTEKEMLLLKNHQAENNLSTLQESSRQLAEARHNFTHHLTVLSGLARADKGTELKNYLAQLTEEIEQIEPLSLTLHPAVNAVATHAFNRAGQSGIKMNCNILLPPSLPVPDIDLCNYLMNLLDNALNAQKDVAENKRWISLTMHIRGSYLYIEASNALAHRVSIDETSGLCISEKGKGHGYGMKTMQDIAARYHSILSIEATEESILVRTAFLLPES